jgi:hypothetical protein
MAATLLAKPPRRHLTHLVIALAKPRFSSGELNSSKEEKAMAAFLLSSSVSDPSSKVRLSESDPSDSMVSPRFYRDKR